MSGLRPRKSDDPGLQNTVETNAAGGEKGATHAGQHF
jgi:hypothetical protein